MNKKMIGIVVLGIAVAFAVYSVVNKPTLQKSSDANSKDINSDMTATLISPEEFDELAEDEDVFVLDVHTPRQTHIPGTDAFIPYNEVSDNVSMLPQDKNTPVIVYCRSGSMSQQASEELAKLGYTQVYDLGGGINEYKKTHTSLSITPDSQDLGTVIYGDVEKAEFTFTNFSAKPVSITRISTSCGCTTAQLDKERLDAYESTTVRVEFDPAFHKDDTDVGELTRTVFIETDHPDFPKLSADITANVVKK